MLTYKWVPPKGLQKKIDRYKKELEKIEKKKSVIQEKIINGVFTDEEGRDLMNGLRNKIKSFDDAISEFESLLIDLPDPDILKQKARKLTMLMDWRGKAENRVKKMTFREKRDLLESLFLPKKQGQQLGIHLRKLKDGWAYEIRGLGKSSEGVLSNKNDINYQEKTL